MESLFSTTMKLESLDISGKSLGEGGFGAVFMSQLDELKVAVKKLSQSEREFNNLVREAARLKKLQYGKHIAYIHGITLKDGSLYMVMEYSEHGDLRNYLEMNKESVTYEQKILFCRGILLGLMYCHSMNVFHGDIKCSNVLLGTNLEPKLTDFGLSMTVDNIIYYSNLCNGSLYWVAPELFSITDEAIYQEFIADPYPCDVYSLGAAFCEISYDGTTEFIDSDDPGTDISVGIVSPIPKNAFLQEIVDGCCQFEHNERISLENCFNLLEDVAEEQLPIPAVNDKWQLIQQDIKANSKLKLPPSFILHRPTENLVVGPSNLLLLEWLCINNCIDAVKYRIQPHKYDQDQIKWLYEISELCKSPEVASFLQPLVQNIEPSRLVLSSLIDNHPQQFIEILIKAGASSYSYTLLKKAIERCHNVTVQAIVDNRNYIENRAAYDAVKFGNAEAVKILADADANANLGWSDYFTEYTPLKIAIDTENVEIVKILLKYSVGVNGGSCYTQSRMEAQTQRKPLHLAALKDNRKIVKLLIDAGAIMDIKSSEWYSLSQSLKQQGNTSMAHFIHNSISKRSSSVEKNSLCAAIRDKQPDLVQTLISDRGKIDEIGLDGYTSLHCAVIVGDEETVKNLIRAGADLDVRTSNKPQNLHSVTDCFNECTPLHIAVSKRHLEIAKLLIKAGADFSAKNGLQQTIMDIAKEDKNEIEKIIMEYAPVNIISIRRAIKSMSHENIKTMTSNQQINAEILSECLCIAASNGENDLVKHLLQYRVNINKLYQGNTPLWWAIFWGNIEVMKILINEGANINIKNDYWGTPLHQCVCDSQLDMVQFLVDKGVDVNARDAGGGSPIQYANNKDILEILINAGADINAKNSYGTTCLIQSVKESDAEMVRFLVDKGAHINIRCGDGDLPIHCAKSKDVLEILINAGADINVKGHYGKTLLIQSVKTSDAEVVQFLVDKGADVNTRGEYGNAPIHYIKSKDVLEVLINAGADIDAKSSFGITCLIQHVKNSNTEIVQFLVDKGADISIRDVDGNASIHHAKNKDIVKILTNTGADTNAKGQYGITYLIQNVKKSDTEMVRFLVGQGVDVNARDEKENAPIHYANSKDILEILVNAGADINAKGQHGETYLIQHVKERDTEMVQFLVDKRADVNARDKDGYASIHFIRDKKIAEILTNAGADINAKNQYGETPLIHHARNSDADTVRFLVDQEVDVDVNAKDEDASIHYTDDKDISEISINTADDIKEKKWFERLKLIKSVKKLNTEMVQFLVDKGADLNARDEKENAPIHYTNDKDVLKVLINAGADVNAKGQYGIVCLIQHVEASNTEMVQLLVKKGADINVRYRDGYLPIHYAKSKDVLEILLNAGTDINAKNQYRETSLIQHVRKSNTEIVQFLVDKGADVNTRDEKENAPIHYAKNKDILEILINAGADINAKGEYKATCLIQHVKTSDTGMMHFLLNKGADVNAKDKYENAPIHYANSKDVLKILINAGADINAKGQYGITCLIQYVRKSDAEVVQFLVDKEADVNARDEYGDAPIHYANSKSVLKVLLNAGADINAKGQYEATCLIQYIKKSDMEMVQFLLDQKADKNAEDKDGNTPIHYIRDKKIAKIFVTAGTDINIKNKHKKALLDILIEEQNRNLDNKQYKKREVCELLEYVKLLR